MRCSVAIGVSGHRSGSCRSPKMDPMRTSSTTAPRQAQCNKSRTRSARLSKASKVWAKPSQAIDDGDARCAADMRRGSFPCRASVVPARQSVDWIRAVSKPALRQMRHRGLADRRRPRRCRPSTRCQAGARTRRRARDRLRPKGASRRAPRSRGPQRARQSCCIGPVGLRMRRRPESGTAHRRPHEPRRRGLARPG